MPRIEETTVDRKVQVAMARCKQFERLDGWSVSKRGNWWRVWEGATVTVFRRGSGWHWCIADGETVTYSKVCFNNREAAVSDLAFALGLLDLCEVE